MFPWCAAVWFWDFGFSIVFYCCVFVLCFGIVIRGGVLECGFSICAGVPGPSGIIRVPAQSFSIGFYGQEFTLEGSRIYVFHLETLQTLERAR